MEVYYDFDFLDNKEEDFLNLFEINKTEVEIVLKAIKEVNLWSKKSIYKNCFTNVFIVLTDCPADNNFAFVDINETLQKIYIEINILNVIKDQQEGMLSKIIFKEKVSLYKFVVFFLLHELAHIVHFQLEMSGKISSCEKFEEHYNKYLHMHKTFQRKNEKDMKHLYFEGDEITENKIKYKLQKKYRKIPTEKFADNFAFRYLSFLT